MSYTSSPCSSVSLRNLLGPGKEAVPCLIQPVTCWLVSLPHGVPYPACVTLFFPAPIFFPSGLRSCLVGYLNPPGFLCFVFCITLHCADRPFSLQDAAAFRHNLSVINHKYYPLSLSGVYLLQDLSAMVDPYIYWQFSIICHNINQIS